MSRTISVTFFTRKDRVDANGQSPIYMRIILNEKRLTIATKLIAKLKDWSDRTGKLKPNTEEARKINHMIDAFKMKAFDMQRELMQEGKEVSLDAIKAKWYGTEVEKPRMIIEIFKEHNAQMKALIGKEFAPRTFVRYETSLKHTVDYLQWKYQMNDIDVKKLNYEFISNYEFYLKSERKCDHNTTVKYLSNFKKIVHICIKNGWLTSDPFVGFKMTKREIERPFLVQEELDSIIEKKFSIERLKQVRDIFIFCCYTGLAYADVQKLSRDEITTGIDGEKWIWTSRQKTDTATRIPLLPQALEIINRYKDEPSCLNKGRLLPVLSNQKMNGYLKEIADACGITKKMTFHTARHTFATTVTLSNGVPIETVSKMLGHRNLKTTQHYAKILDIKVGADMRVLRERLGEKTNSLQSTSTNQSKAI
ncbi:MAG: site-specific integrase [Cyclobacteriaceae bacterium]|nr:site-specific integrase [Cytophagales bacterium]MCZ8327370.1 site-specific integrase [Cyclobacteriaceae bacterium]